MLAPQITEANVDKQLTQMGDQTKVLTDITDEMGKGKYKSADDVGRRATEGASADDVARSPATQPTTAPAMPSAPRMPQ